MLCFCSGIMRKSSVSGSSSGSQERAGKGVTFAPEHSCVVSSQPLISMLISIKDYDFYLLPVGIISCM